MGVILPTLEYYRLAHIILNFWRDPLSTRKSKQTLGNKQLSLLWNFVFNGKKWQVADVENALPTIVIHNFPFNTMLQ